MAEQEKTANDYLNSLNEFASIHIRKAIAGLEFDKTELAEIVDITNRSNGDYVVFNGSTRYHAYTENTSYTLGTKVYVNIPNNDMSGEKTIIRKYISKDYNRGLNYIMPLDRYTSDVENILEGELNSEGYFLLANWNKEAVKLDDNNQPILDENNQLIPEPKMGGQIINIYTSEDLSNNSEIQVYDYLGLSANFQTLMRAQKITSGNYGLLITVKFNYKVDQEIREQDLLYVLDTSNMVGNLYDFFTGFEQQALFELPTYMSDRIIKQIKIDFFQDGNFYNADGLIQVAPNDLGILPPDNIIVRDIKLGFGNDMITEQTRDKLTIYSRNGYTYDATVKNDALNKRQLYLKWYHNNPDKADDEHPYGILELMNSINKIPNETDETFTGIIWWLQESQRTWEEFVGDQNVLIENKRQLERLQYIYKNRLNPLISEQEDLLDSWITNTIDLEDDSLPVFSDENEQNYIDYWFACDNNGLNQHFEKLKDGFNLILNRDYIYNNLGETGQSGDQSYFQLNASGENKIKRAIPNVPIVNAHGCEWGNGWSKITTADYDDFSIDFLPDLKKQTTKVKCVIEYGIAKDDGSIDRENRYYTVVESDVIEFNNMAWIPDSITWDAAIGLTVSFNDNSEGVYSLYNGSDGSLLNINNATRDRALEADIQSSYSGRSYLNGNEALIWKIPKYNTMIEIQRDEIEIMGGDWLVNPNLEETDNVELNAKIAFSKDIFEAYKAIIGEYSDDYYYLIYSSDKNVYERYRYDYQIEIDELLNRLPKLKLNNNDSNTDVVVVTEENIDSVYIDDLDDDTKELIERIKNLRDKKNLQPETRTVYNRLRYHIGQSLRPENVYNTIVCFLIKNEVMVKSSVTMSFLQQGTAGTDYTFTLGLGKLYDIYENENGEQVWTEIGGTETALTIGEEGYREILFNLYDTQNNPITLPAAIRDMVIANWIEEENKTKGFWLDYGDIWGNKGAFEYKVFTESDYKTRFAIRIKDGKKISECAGIVLKATIDTGAITSSDDKIITVLNGIKFTQLLPLHVRVKTATKYTIDSSDFIYYSDAGGQPRYYNNVLALRENDEILNEYYIRIKYGDGNQTDNFTIIRPGYPYTYMGVPHLSENNKLLPYPIFLPEVLSTKIFIEYYKGVDPNPVSRVNSEEDLVEESADNLVYIAPLVILQNRYQVPVLNTWDGSLVINKDDSTILATTIGAGHKNSDNTFTGIIMGDVTKTDNTQEGSKRTTTGLYGYHEGEQSFGFLEDGTAFIGKSSKGQILLDGNKSVIQSASYKSTKNNEVKEGTLIDLDDGFIDINSSTKNENGVAVQRANIHLDASSGERNAPYFRIAVQKQPLESNDSNLIPVINIDKNSYYLQTADYKEAVSNENSYIPGSGLKIDLQKGEFISQGKLTINGARGSKIKFGDSSNYVELGLEEQNPNAYFKMLSGNATTEMIQNQAITLSKLGIDLNSYLWHIGADIDESSIKNSKWVFSNIDTLNINSGKGSQNSIFSYDENLKANIETMYKQVPIINTTNNNANIIVPTSFTGYEHIGEDTDQGTVEAVEAKFEAIQNTMDKQWAFINTDASSDFIGFDTINSQSAEYYLDNAIQTETVKWNSDYSKMDQTWDIYQELINFFKEKQYYKKVNIELKSIPKNEDEPVEVAYRSKFIPIVENVSEDTEDCISIEDIINEIKEQQSDYIVYYKLYNEWLEIIEPWNKWIIYNNTDKIYIMDKKTKEITIYKSLINNNLGNDPLTNSAAWTSVIDSKKIEQENLLTNDDKVQIDYYYEFMDRSNIPFILVYKKELENAQKELDLAKTVMDEAKEDTNAALAVWNGAKSILENKVTVAKTEKLPRYSQIVEPEKDNEKLIVDKEDNPYPYLNYYFNDYFNEDTTEARKNRYKDCSYVQLSKLKIDANLNAKAKTAATTTARNIFLNKKQSWYYTSDTAARADKGFCNIEGVKNTSTNYLKMYNAYAEIVQKREDFIAEYRNAWYHFLKKNLNSDDDILNNKKEFEEDNLYVEDKIFDAYDYNQLLKRYKEYLVARLGTRNDENNNTIIDVLIPDIDFYENFIQKINIDDDQYGFYGLNFYADLLNFCYNNGVVELENGSSEKLATFINDLKENIANIEDNINKEEDGLIALKTSARNAFNDKWPNNDLYDIESTKESIIEEANTISTVLINFYNIFSQNNYETSKLNFLVNNTKEDDTVIDSNFILPSLKTAKDKIDNLLEDVTVIEDEEKYLTDDEKGQIQTYCNNININFTTARTNLLEKNISENLDDNENPLFITISDDDNYNEEQRQAIIQYNEALQKLQSIKSLYTEDSSELDWNKIESKKKDWINLCETTYTDCKDLLDFYQIVYDENNSSVTNYWKSLIDKVVVFNNLVSAELDLEEKEEKLRLAEQNLRDFQNNADLLVTTDFVVNIAENDETKTVSIQEHNLEQEWFQIIIPCNFLCEDYAILQRREAILTDIQDLLQKTVHFTKAESANDPPSTGRDIVICHFEESYKETNKAETPHHFQLYTKYNNWQDAIKEEEQAKELLNLITQFLTAVGKERDTLKSELFVKMNSTEVQDMFNKGQFTAIYKSETFNKEPYNGSSVAKYTYFSTSQITSNTQYNKKITYYRVVNAKDFTAEQEAIDNALKVLEAARKEYNEIITAGKKIIPDENSNTVKAYLEAQDKVEKAQNKLDKYSEAYKPILYTDDTILNNNKSYYYLDEQENLLPEYKEITNLEERKNHIIYEKLDMDDLRDDLLTLLSEKLLGDEIQLRANIYKNKILQYVEALKTFLFYNQGNANNTIKISSTDSQRIVSGLHFSVNDEGYLKASAGEMENITVKSLNFQGYNDDKGKWHAGAKGIRPKWMTFVTDITGTIIKETVGFTTTVIGSGTTSYTYRDAFEYQVPETTTLTSKFHTKNYPLMNISTPPSTPTGSSFSLRKTGEDHWQEGDTLYIYEATMTGVVNGYRTDFKNITKQLEVPYKAEMQGTTNVPVVTAINLTVSKVSMWALTNDSVSSSTITISS